MGCLNKLVYYPSGASLSQVPTVGRRAPGPLGRAVAEILHDEMRSQGLPQFELGRLTGLSQSQISTYLRGVRGLTLDEADDLCRALGLTLLEVLTQAADY